MSSEEIQIIKVQGKLARNAEMMATSTGKFVTHLTIPVTMVGSTGKEFKTWFRASVWGKDAEKTADLPKGTSIKIIGTVSVSPYLSKEGEAKASLELHVRDFIVLSRPEIEDIDVPQEVVDASTEEIDA
jgi:single-stranded DNA-binding protein